MIEQDIQACSACTMHPSRHADLLRRNGADRGAALAAVQSLAGDMVLIMIYVGFLYVTSAGSRWKLDQVFVQYVHEQRAGAPGSGPRSSRTMEQYLRGCRQCCRRLPRR